MLNESQLYERLARQQILLEEKDAAFSQLLTLLGQVVSGEVDASRVLVNLTDKTCLFASEGQRPPVPATINGLPVCIIAPEPKEPKTNDPA